MRCDDLGKRLSRGLPLTAEMVEHAWICAGCRTMLEALQAPNEMPDARRLESVEQLITGLLTPVKPLPSDRTMISLAMVTFVVFSLLATMPFGYGGFQHLTSNQKVWYYSVILVAAAFFSLAIVQQIVPGSRRRVAWSLVPIASLIALATVSAALFENYDLDRFVSLGVPCLRLGVGCAAVSGALSTLLLRKGFSTSPVQASCIMGFFGGLSGVAVLALHCSIQNTAHIVVWHLGAMLLGGLGGAAIEFWRERRRMLRPAETIRIKPHN